MPLLQWLCRTVYRRIVISLEIPWRKFNWRSFGGGLIISFTEIILWVCHSVQCRYYQKCTLGLFSSGTLFILFLNTFLFKVMKLLSNWKSVTTLIYLHKCWQVPEMMQTAFFSVYPVCDQFVMKGSLTVHTKFV